MTPRARIPISLYIVAALFILFGLQGVVKAILQLRAGDFRIPLDVFCLFVGGGLLRRRSGWRLCALWLTGFNLGVVVLYMVWFLVSDQRASFPSAVPSWMPSATVTAVVFMIVFVAGEVWGLYVLTRGDVVGIYTSNPA